MDELNTTEAGAAKPDDFTQFEGLATGADGLGLPEEPAPGEPGGPPAPPDYTTEAKAAVAMFSACMTGYAPRTESIWTEAAQGRVAGALAPVMEKYKFTFGALPPEVTLIIVAGPLLWQSSKMVAAQMAEEKAKAPPKVTAKVVDKSGTGQDVAPGPAISPQTALYQ